MADMADRIMEVPLLTSMPSVNSINPMVASASPSVLVTLESLAERVEDLAKQVKLLQTCSSSRALSNSFRRRFSGSPRCNLAAQSTADSGMCHYHQRFQEKARNCIKPYPNFQLKAANNSTIKTYGFLALPLDLGLRRHFSWRFVIADIPLPIIGSDFLAHYGPLPNCKRKLLLDRITSLSVRGQSTGILRNVSHSTVHHIRTTPGPPVFCHPRCLAPEQMKIAKAEFEAMVLEGTARRTRPLPDRIVDLQNFPVPKTARDLRRFLGMVNFYRRFLPSAAKYQSSLNDAFSRFRGAQPLTWASELDTAFSKCKEALSEVTLIMHPAADVPLGLFTDAYACHFGAALMQCVDDHKPITYAFLQRRERLPPVQLNQLSFIGQFTTDIQHISGADNVVADAFFRISYIAPPPVDLKAIVEAQKGDMELLDLQRSDNTLKLKKIEVTGSDATLLCQEPDLLFPLLSDAEFLMLCMG
ncbi:uncharacterized protein TNIN_202931 [Trichonephila inaurata madagascariensis]|uniref:Reverse transcriptase/retrotransposon-derived protein RNase H-like domain-containing protein n=1 Tax=Trichonephila inaurata madagascariensis TaxID=2747483 RepID=A0A8X7BWA2_9ARAC|nr:uncharacterized protein TNIN_202931 [Trichonephila inaurata madagascariensis]